jgi:hypothetical protein
MTHLRGHVDYDPALHGAVGRLEHFSDGYLRHQEGSSDIKREHAIQMRLGYLDKRLRNVYAGVIDKYVEPLEPIDLGTELLTVGYVADERFGAPTSINDVLLNFLKFAARSAKEKHLGSRLSKSKGCRRTKAAAGARNQRDAAVQPEGCRDDRGTGYRSYGVSPGLATRPT